MDRNSALDMRLMMISRESFLTVGVRFKIYAVSSTVKAQNNVHHLLQSEIEKRKDMKKPKFVCFNMYYSMIVVVTPTVIKMYRLRDGFMQTLVTDVFADS